MELAAAQPPPPYATHDPTELHLPAVPQHTFTALSPPQSHPDLNLPDLKTVLSAGFESSAGLASPTHSAYSGRSWRPGSRHQSPVSVRSLPPIDPGPQLPPPINAIGIEQGYGRKSLEAGPFAGSPMDTGSVFSPRDGERRATSSVSMDDEKVRIAAEALQGLGSVGFVQRSSPQAPPSSGSPMEMSSDRVDDEEPLLQLFAKAHPWVGGTINGSLNAYSTTKQYSPRFVQYGANLVERNITTPVVSTVSTVGRMTGVESGLRWYYGGGTNRPRDLEAGPEEGDRAADAMEIAPEQINSLAGMALDTIDARTEPLPLYHANRPPSYREEASPSVSNREVKRPSHHRSWSSQVFVMTSGLGVALSETSRRSLIFCLNMLGQAAEHVQTVMEALRLVLVQYDQARGAWHSRRQYGSREKKASGEAPNALTEEHDEAARRLAEAMKGHSEEIWSTLKAVVNHVSTAAGGALPENARHFVRSQLLSMPQRWQFVSARSAPPSNTDAPNGSNDGDHRRPTNEASAAAHRMLAFATEGLDMMGQVSETMRLTLHSAEKWLARAGHEDATMSTNTPMTMTTSTTRADSGSGGGEEGFRPHRDDLEMADASEKRG